MLCYLNSCQSNKHVLPYLRDNSTLEDQFSKMFLTVVHTKVSYTSSKILIGSIEWMRKGILRVVNGREIIPESRDFKI